MGHDTRTTTRLLEGLFDPAADDVWLEFDQRYRPIIIGVARKLGLADQDAADVAQETLARFVHEYREGRYDRERGRLRTWILAIARHRIADHYRGRAKAGGWRGDSMIDVIPEERQLDEVWRTERRMAILRRALDVVAETGKSNPKTIKAFEMLAFHQQPADAVAGRLGMTLDDVYQAKNRIAKRIRQVAIDLEAQYDEEEVGGPTSSGDGDGV